LFSCRFFKKTTIRTVFFSIFAAHEYWTVDVREIIYTITVMTKEEVIKKVNIFLIEEIEIEESLLKEDALLKENLGIDSLDFVDIVVIVERYFGFKIKPEDMANVKTLAQFYAYIYDKVNENQQ
jgi:acyl carrier protein